MVKKTRTFPSTLLNWGGIRVGGGSETIEGSTHDLSGLGRYDVGGAMLLNRSIDTYGLARQTTWKKDAYLTWLGTSPISDFWKDSVLPSDSNVKASGTTAIARTTPTNPSFDLSNAVGELMIDGAPSVIGVSTWRDRALKARNAGSEYLNYQFGWLPLVNDVRNLARTVKNHQKLMSHFYEGSGKNIRVSYEFPVSSTSYDLSNTSTYDAILRWDPAYFYMSSPQRQSGLLYRSSATWFNGCFTYHAIPPTPTGGAMDTINKYAAYADHLLGVRLTPETLWNLTPWSWAVDWFTNTGDIIHNISAFSRDSLVLKYGYVMCHDRLIASVYMKGGTDYHGSITDGSVTYLRERKRRFAASPYFGFGTTGSLSGAQKAILLALGLSRTGF